MSDRVTYDDDGNLDEVAREDASVHLERLNDNEFFLQAGDVRLTLWSKTPILVSVEPPYDMPTGPKHIGRPA